MPNAAATVALLAGRAPFFRQACHGHGCVPICAATHLVMVLARRSPTSCRAPLITSSWAPVLCLALGRLVVTALQMRLVCWIAHIWILSVPAVADSFAGKSIWRWVDRPAEILATTRTRASEVSIPRRAGTCPANGQIACATRMARLCSSALPWTIFARLPW